MTNGKEETVLEKLVLIGEDGYARIGHGGTLGLNRLTICDDNGRIFMDFKMMPDGKPIFQVFDGNTLRACLGFLNDNVGLFLCDGKGVPRMQLTVGADGMPVLTFADKDGTERALLALDPEGNPILNFLDARGGIRTELAQDGEGSSGLRFVDKKGKVRIGFGVVNDGSPVLSFSDQKNRERFGISLEKDGRPVLGLMDTAGTLRAVLGLEKNGNPDLSLADKDGEVMWSAQPRKALTQKPAKGRKGGAK